MSNRRKLRTPAKKARNPEPAPPSVPSPQQVRNAMYHLERQAHVVRGDLKLSAKSRRREQGWALSTLGRDHGHDNGVTVTIKSRRTTAAGLLRARLAQADGKVRQGDLVRIVHPPTGSAGAAHVRRVVGRTGQIYLEPCWGATIEKPLHRTQASARAEARAEPEPCPTCGKPQGEDCITASGKRAAWPHAARDPILTKGVRAMLTPDGLKDLRDEPGDDDER